MADSIEEIKLEANGLSFSALKQGNGDDIMLCLHGFPDTYRSYRYQLPFFAEQGFTVIAPMLRGYEPATQHSGSSRQYYIADAAADVIAWIDSLGVERVHYVGHDWGAIVGYAAAALAPRRFYTLTTMAVPHFRALIPALPQNPGQFLMSWYIMFFQLPFVPEQVVPRNNFEFIENLWRDWSPGWAYPADEIQNVKDQLAEPGVLKAALGYYRALTNVTNDKWAASRELSVAPIRVPTLAMTGIDDGCLQADLLGTMEIEDFPYGLKLQKVANAGHFLHQEKPDEVNGIILEWVNRVR